MCMLKFMNSTHVRCQSQVQMMVCSRSETSAFCCFGNHHSSFRLPTSGSCLSAWDDMNDVTIICMKIHDVSRLFWVDCWAAAGSGFLVKVDQRQITLVDNTHCHTTNEHTFIRGETQVVATWAFLSIGWSSPSCCSHQAPNLCPAAVAWQGPFQVFEYSCPVNRMCSAPSRFFVKNGIIWYLWVELIEQDVHVESCRVETDDWNCVC